MIDARPTRRRLLQSLALGAGGLSFAGARGLPRAEAASAPSAPKRVVFVMSMHGLHENTGWRSFAAPGTGPTDFAFAGMTTPLEPLKGDVVVLDGVALRPSLAGDQHISGYTSFLTASIVTDTGKPTGMSVDQYLAQKVGRQVTPKFPSLATGVHFNGGYVSFLNDGSSVPVTDDPYAVYRKMFADVTSTPGAAPDAALTDRLMRRKSVLDGVARDLTSFRKRLPPEDRLRADAQLETLRTLEQRLSTGAGAPPVGCRKVDPKAGVNLKDSRLHAEVSQLQFDVLTAAFACDLTRIVSFVFDTAHGCNFAPVGRNDSLHTLSHDFRDTFVLGRRVHFEQIAYFAQKLKAIPEGTGSMLDNTIIFVGSEISQGHQHERMPFLTIGGKNLGVRGGRYLTYPGGRPTAKQGREGAATQAQLYVSFLNALGLPDTHFGLKEDPYNGVFPTGPLPGYLAA